MSNYRQELQLRCQGGNVYIEPQPVFPHAEYEAKRRRAAGDGMTFDYRQCRRLLCLRWFPDQRLATAAPATWCPYCLGKAKDAFLRRVCLNSPDMIKRRDRLRDRARHMHARRDLDKKTRVQTDSVGQNTSASFNAGKHGKV